MRKLGYRSKRRADREDTQTWRAAVDRVEVNRALLARCIEAGGVLTTSDCVVISDEAQCRRQVEEAERALAYLEG